MARKLSADELAYRVRERGRERSQRHRERRIDAGSIQTMVWLPATLRARLDAAAAAAGRSLSETAAMVIDAGLMTATLTTTTPITTPRASNDADATLDMFGNPTMDNTGRDEPVTTTTSRVIQSDKAALMTEVGTLLDAGLSGGEIARRFNDAGRRTASGSEFIGANLLRDYRKWTAKKTVV